MTLLQESSSKIRRPLLIDNVLLNTLREYAHTDLNNEVCGLITGDIDNKFWYACNFHPIKNVNTNVGLAKDAYTMDPDESFVILKKSQLMNEHVKVGNFLVATFHTHPFYTPYPSAIDIDTAAYKVVYIIYSPIYDKFTFNLWTGDWFEPMPMGDIQ
jgi:proteasome lid subunit RPN8/RPN11